LHKTFTQNVLN